MRRVLSLVAVLCVIFAPGSFEGAEPSAGAAELSGRVLAPTVHESRPPPPRELTEDSRPDCRRARGQGQGKGSNGATVIALSAGHGTVSTERGTFPHEPPAVFSLDPIRGPPQLSMA
jgi:hypothetical protein